MGRLARAWKTTCIKSDGPCLDLLSNTHVVLVSRDRSFFQVICVSCCNWCSVMHRCHCKRIGLSLWQIPTSTARKFKSFDGLIEILFFISSYTYCLKIVFNTYLAEDWLVVRRIEGIFWDFAKFVLTNKGNLVSIIFILERQTLLNAVKLDEATQDSGVTIDWFACFREATNYLR